MYYAILVANASKLDMRKMEGTLFPSIFPIGYSFFSAVASNKES